MRAQKLNKLLQQPFVFTGGSFTFTAPKAGYWKFVAWGPGGSGAGSGAASGSYGEITRFVGRLQTVAVAAPPPGADTTLTFADGSIATAGQASGSVAGVASGFDTSLPGTAGTVGGTSSAGGAGQGTGGGAGGANAGANDGGAGAPAILPYRGGRGGSGTTGATGYGAGSGQLGGVGGVGLVLAVFMRV